MNNHNIIDMIQTGKNLKGVRESNHMTTDDLSVAMMGVSKDHIKQIEMGEFEPTLEYIFDFCNLFNLSIDEIIASKI